MKLYIVEDSPQQQEFVRETIQSELPEAQAVMFSDGIELYRKAMAEPPDMLLLDIIVPNLSGLAICRLFKFQQAFRQMPILVTSSIIDRDIRERVKQAGADAFLPKPFVPADLISEIRRLTAGGN